MKKLLLSLIAVFGLTALAQAQTKVDIENKRVITTEDRTVATKTTTTTPTVRRPVERVIVRPSNTDSRVDVDKKKVYKKKKFKNGKKKGHYKHDNRSKSKHYNNTGHDNRSKSKHHN